MDSKAKCIILSNVHSCQRLHFHPTSLGLSTITIDNSLVYTHIQQSLYHHITHKAFVERPGETLEVDTAILQDGISWITFGKARTSCPSLIVSFRYIFTLLLFHPAFLTQRNNGTILPAQSPSSAQENHSAIEQHPLIVPIRWDDRAEGMIQSIHWHSIIFFCTRLLLCYGSTATRGYLFLRTTEESLYLNPVFSTRDTLQHY